MIVTVLETTFNKAKPKEITYRCYKNFDRRIFREKLKHELQNCENYTQYKSSFLKTLNGHAPLKKKIVRANEVPYMTKALRKKTRQALGPIENKKTTVVDYTR